MYEYTGTFTYELRAEGEEEIPDAADTDPAATASVTATEAAAAVDTDADTARVVRPGVEADLDAEDPQDAGSGSR